MEVEGLRGDGSVGGGGLPDLQGDLQPVLDRLHEDADPSSTLSTTGTFLSLFLILTIQISILFSGGSMPSLISHDSRFSPSRGEPSKTPPRGEGLPSSSGPGSPSPIGLENSWPAGGLLREYQAAWNLLMRAPATARALVMGSAAPPVAPPISSTPQADSSVPQESTGLTLSTDGELLVLFLSF